MREYIHSMAAQPARTEKEIIDQLDADIMSGCDLVDGTECYALLLQKALKLQTLLHQEKTAKLALVKEYIAMMLGRDRQRKNSATPYNLRTQF